MINKMSSVGAPTSRTINQVGTAPESGAAGGPGLCSSSADAGGEITGARLAKDAR